MPVAKNRTDSSACLIGEADAAESFDDGGIAHFLFSRIEQLSRGGEGVARVPKYSTVGEQLDGCLATVITVILMHQQVDGSLAKGDVVRWIVVTA